MFCNGSLMDEGDLARLGEATIAGMTSLEVLFIQPMIVYDIGGLFGPISCPPILEVVHTLDGRRNMRRFVHFRTNAHI